MTRALPDPSISALAGHWTWQPIAMLLAVAGVGWYLRAVGRLRGRGGTWPGSRVAVFLGGVALFGYTSCGWPQAYHRALFWVWTSQLLTLLLIVPLIVLAGQPLQLLRACRGRPGSVDRFLQSGVGRVLANPLVGPALVPLLSAALFFGPVPAWAISSAPVDWAVQLLVVIIGALIVLPLVGPDDHPSSLAVGLSLAIGSFELVLDAVPGIALRLHSSLVTSFFDHRTQLAWSPSPLHDQQIAGGVLWCVAELIDLPFLLLVFRRWLRADARDAAQVDAVLEAERASRAALADPAGEPRAVSDAPWWLSDPAMQRRYGDRNR